MIHRIDSVNPDIDDRVIKPNQARNAKNLRFSVSDSDENLSGGILVYGNTKLDFTPPPGVNRVIGVCNDYENQVIYFASFNDNGTARPLHGIYQIENDIVTPIIQESWLNFSIDMDVSIDSIDDKIYWTDGVNQPRMINVKKATGNLYENGVQVLYPKFFAEWMYTQIKRPGALPLIVTLFDKTDATTNTTTYSIVDNYPIASFDILPNTEDEQSVDGYQFSYYYIYDNYEESRLAPISKLTFFTKKLHIIFPVQEFDEYVKDNNIIRDIVIVYRLGNEGSWNVLKKIENTPANYDSVFNLLTYNKELIPNYGPSIRHFVENMIFVQVLPVDADITDSYFDAMPIQSTCNTIAINRIFHSNYKIDYENWTNLFLNLTVEKNTQTFFVTYRDGTTVQKTGPAVVKPGDQTFMFGRYKAGIELLDDFGRRIGVISEKEVLIPKPTYSQDKFKYANPTLDPNVYEKNQHPDNDKNFTYQIKYDITGVLPPWAKSYRVVITKNLDYIYFFKTQVKVFYWYSSNSANALSSLPIFYEKPKYADWYPINVIQSNDKKDNYNYEGLAFKFTSKEPFIYSAEEETYICFAQEYKYSFGNVITGGIPTTGIELKEYKIDSYDGNYLYVRRPNADNVNSVLSRRGNRVDRKEDSTQILSTFVSSELPKNSYLRNEGEDAFVLSRQNFQYQVYVYSKKKQSEEVYYQNENTFVVPSNYIAGTPFSAKGVLRGDCYITEYKKMFGGVALTEAKFYFDGPVQANYTNNDGVFTLAADKPGNGNLYQYRDVTINGWGISMNPCDIFSTIWSSSIGQPSIVNEDQKQTIAYNNIIPSGQIILGSQINGLNKMNSIDAQSMPAENGPITATVITNTAQNQPGVMLAIGSLAIQSVYLNAIQQTASDGTSTISLSKNILGTNRPLSGQFGTKRLRSITVTPESVIYWWSEVVNDFIRYTNAGMERLGKTYMFGNYLRNNYANNTSVFTMYDQVTDEALLIPFGKTAVAFNEKYKSFQGEREYSDQSGKTAELGASLALKHYMFLDGEVWVTKIGNPDNNFFGVDKTPELTIITNESPAIVKNWNTIKVFGPVPAATECKTETTVNRQTTIPRDWYVQRKNDYEAAIRRDLNSGGILSGKAMESRILYSTFVFSITGFDKLNFIEVKSNKSVVQ